MARNNYLNNKDILKEIHKSKTTYCCFQTPEDNAYDMILPDVGKINKKNTLQARKDRAERLAKLALEQANLDGTKHKLDEFEIKLKDVKDTDVVFRVMTWDHIPVDDAKTRKARMNALEIEDVEDPLITEYDEEDLTHTKYLKVNFPPFQHWRINDTGEPECIGKSHWTGGITTGKFSRDHGKMTPKLAHMFIKLCERYATRSNWRGYCVDQETEALTNRGWLDINEITDDDKIMSYNGTELAWSGIQSIFRGEFDGLMHKLTLRGYDSLITPNHKIVTDRGLVPVELLKEQDRIILLADGENSISEEHYTDAFVELAGWIVTEGCYEVERLVEGKIGNIKRITIYQNAGPKADRIRNCLTELKYKFSEGIRGKNLCFAISRSDCREIVKTFPEKNLNMEFILKLTKRQRELLIDTMIDGDGWRRVNGNRSYVQKDKNHVDLFQALCVLAGIRTNIHLGEHMSFGKPSLCYTVNLFANSKNTTKVHCVNLHGGLRKGHKYRGMAKVEYPNEPTTYYQGQVWCPETEFGCFVARRNGTVYLTGNTYNDEMRSQALLQLSQIGLQFDESKSQNPFAYYTAAITNSFTRVLNIEKRNQNLRDDILEMNNLTPSYTRQGDWGAGIGHGADE